MVGEDCDQNGGGQGPSVADATSAVISDTVVGEKKEEYEEEEAPYEAGGDPAASAFRPKARHGMNSTIITEMIKLINSKLINLRFLVSYGFQNHRNS